MPLQHKRPDPVDPDDLPITCEVCGKEVRRGDAVSYHVYIAMPGLLGETAMHCDDVQHFTCSPDHAVEAVHICIDEHLHPELLRKHEAQQVSQ